MYQLRSPAPELREFVEHYWFMTHPNDEPVQLRVDVFVDGRADLIFNHGVFYHREIVGGATSELRESNVDAQRLVPIRISQRGLVNISGVRLHLGGLGPFVNAPLATWTGLTPHPALVFGADAIALDRALAESDDLDRKSHLLDAFLLGRLDTGGRYREFVSALAQITEQRPRAEKLGPTDRRHRARLFARYLGIPPRTIGRIVRFQHTLRALMVDPDGSLAELASEAGYFDQAHFIREFREMTGGVPRGYRGYYPPDSPADFAPNLVAYIQDRRDPVTQD